MHNGFSQLLSDQEIFLSLQLKITVKSNLRIYALEWMEDIVRIKHFLSRKKPTSSTLLILNPSSMEMPLLKVGLLEITSTVPLLDFWVINTCLSKHHHFVFITGT